MPRWAIALLFSLIGLIFGLGVTSPRVLGSNHLDVRQFVIKSQLAQAGDDAVVFVGDSITESALLPSDLCGHRIVNAGVGGTTVESYMQVLRGIPAFAASAIVVALGTNDAARAAKGGFADHYSQLLTVLRTYSSRVLLAGLPPVDPDGALAEDYIDPDKAGRINEAVRRIAHDSEIDFVDLRATMTMSDLTVDGVHLSPDGYKVWTPEILRAAKAELHCG